MNDKIICKLELFDFDQRVFLPDGKKINVPLERLTDYLTFSCYNKRCNKIHFFGDENYINKLIEDIKEIETKEYAQNNIEFEVN